MSMYRRPDRTSPSHASHVPVDSRPSSSPLLSHHHSPSPTNSSNSMDHDDYGPTAIVPHEPSPSPVPTPASFPAREDCWSEDATSTLVEAWGDRYRQLNRGNLRQKDWQDVAGVVNARHGHVKKARRTGIQCKNRIDTLKKKYKTEKARVLESNGKYIPQWPFFAALDSLIGSSYKPSPAPPPPRRKISPAPPLPILPPPSSVPVGPRSKRPAPTPAMVDDSFSRRNFSAMAAAAAVVEAEEESDTSRSRSGAGSARRDQDGAEAYKQLAEAIGRFGDIYERVEETKQRQMVELEKQRMQFAKDLEIQRMKLFMESQIKLEKIKRARRTSEADGYL